MVLFTIKYTTCRKQPIFLIKFRDCLFTSVWKNQIPAECKDDLVKEICPTNKRILTFEHNKHNREYCDVWDCEQKLTMKSISSRYMNLLGIDNLTVIFIIENSINNKKCRSKYEI